MNATEKTDTIVDLAELAMKLQKRQRKMARAIAQMEDQLARVSIQIGGLSYELAQIARLNNLDVSEEMAEEMQYDF